MKSKILILTSITALILVMSANTHAKIYKWIDANGQTHYTAQPPTQDKIKANNIEDEIRANAGKYRPSGRSTNVSAVNPDDNSKDQLSGPDQKLVKYCDGQRNNLKQLQKNFRNVWIDAKGEKTTLNQEQRKEKVASLQKKITEDCSEVKATAKS